MMNRIGAKARSLAVVLAAVVMGAVLSAGGGSVVSQGASSPQGAHSAASVRLTASRGHFVRTQYRCARGGAHGVVSVKPCESFRQRHMPWWTRRNCQSPTQMNCFARDPGDGGRHPHFRSAMGPIVCVYFAGSEHYARMHDYCIDNGKQVTP